MDARGRSASLVSGPEQSSGSSAPLRERSAERRTFLVCTLRCRVPCGARRLAALHCGVFHPGTVLPGPDAGAEPHADPGQLSPALHPDRVQPSKAALHSKGERKPGATRTSCARNTGARAPHLLRQPNASGRRPQLSKRVDHKAGKANVKSKTHVCKVHQHCGGADAGSVVCLRTRRVAGTILWGNVPAVWAMCG